MSLPQPRPISILMPDPFPFPVDDPFPDDIPGTSYTPPPGPCDAPFDYRFRLTQSLKTFDTRRLSAWSGGGGPIWQLEADTGNPFAGRDFGSGDRKTIYGSRSYGSGYPDWSYPVPDPATVAGRGFPYGLWPIYWSGNYAGSAEYGLATAELFRPGGELVQAPLRPTPANASNYTTVEEETYWLIGDQSSIFSMLTNMVNWCHAEPIWPELFEPANNAIGVAGNNTNQGVKFHPGNVLQYYRASTFALAHPAYNNSYAHPPLNISTLLTHDQSTPLNDVMKFSTWLKCINETIADALPILDAPPATSPALNGGAIAGIVVASIMAWVLLGGFVMLIWLCMCAIYERITRQIRQMRQLARDRQREIYEERKRMDDFQNYP